MMAIIFALPSDPTDLVMQGQILGDEPKGWVPDYPPYMGLWPMNQGEMVGLTDITPPAVPRAMIGWVPYYCNPDAVGPFVNLASGDVSMIPIGPAKPPDMIVDAAQRFLLSSRRLDLTGSPDPADCCLPIDADQSAPTMDITQGPDAPWEELASVQVPRAAILMTGFGTWRNGTVSAPMPDFYGLMKGDWYVESTLRWLVSGTTRDNAGSPLAGCRVVLLAPERIDAYQAQCVMAETVSDGSGAFSFIVGWKDGFQLIGYKPDSPDVAGITRNDVQAVIYA